MENNKKDIGVKAVALKGAMVEGLTSFGEAEGKYAVENIAKYIELTNAKYLMLLNHENRYYTIFDVSDKDKGTIQGSAKNLFNFLVEDVAPHYGELKLVDFDSTTGAIEVWFNNNCFVLFDYSNGVVTL